MEVLRALPPDQRQRCAQDLNGFRLGLYGPDPLIFYSPRVKALSDSLHRRWRQDTLPHLERAIRHGSPLSASFGAGCLLHFYLDETVHPRINRWEESGSSHFRLELALDRLILKEQGLTLAPRLLVKDGDRISATAAALLPPATEGQYRAGLRNMALMTAYIRRQGTDAVKNVTRREWGQAKVLRQLLEEAILPAAGWLSLVLEPSSVLTPT
jgi:hypothetical protein